MWRGILPFGAVVRDFARNVWYLRLFLCLIIAGLAVSAIALALVELSGPGQSTNPLYTIGRASGIAVNNAFLGGACDYAPTTLLGQVLTAMQKLLGFVLLGMLIWVVEQSLSRHRLKRAMLLILPSDRNL